jgi:hypothetical protein
MALNRWSKYYILAATWPFVASLISMLERLACLEILMLKPTSSDCLIKGSSKTTSLCAHFDGYFEKPLPKILPSHQRFWWGMVGILLWLGFSQLSKI